MTNTVKPKSLIHSVISRLFCSHDYNLVNQFEIKSEYDIVEDSGRTPNSYCSLTRKYIWDYKCSKCQKLKRLVNETYCNF